MDLGREPINPATRLGITLRYLAAGDSMVSLTYLFRVGLSTVSYIVSETTVLIWQVLQPKYVSCPNLETWMTVASGFENTWNFPNCIGAIDGKHITIQAPPHSGSEFFNYKGRHSIVLLAVVDDKYSFSLVDIGAQGRQSDGGIFRNSNIGQLIQNKLLNFPAPRSLSPDAPPLPYVIVGDEAFPLLDNLLKPYSSKGGLDVNKNIFNYRLSRARRISENAFGILSSRWRIYGKNIIGKLENIDNVVKATVCLHNYIMKKYTNNSYVNQGLLDTEQNGIIIPGAWRKYSTQVQPIGSVGANTYASSAKDVRDEYCRYFNEEGAVSWQWNHV